MKTPLSFNENVPLTWFLSLRRIAFVGQALVLVWAVQWLELHLPVAALAGVLCLIPLGEILFRSAARIRRLTISPQILAALLFWDTLTLTLLLYLSGGPTNPFSIVYLVQVVLSAVLLGSFWTWGLAVLSTLCFGALFLWHQPVHAFHQHDHATGLSLHLQGMLFSYALVAALVAYFLGRIVAEKRQAERKAEVLLNAQQKLAAITTITTDAAHRLGTPLASLGLVSHELSRMLEDQGEISREDLRDDVTLLQGEVARCKEILGELCAHSGAVQGESAQFVEIGSLVRSALTGLSADAARIDFQSECSDEVVLTQSAPIVMALRAILKNALQASGGVDGGLPVQLRAIRSGQTLRIVVSDRGSGMSAEELSQVKEPFYTTKDHGMGLGVYIAELVALQLGGALHYESKPGEGTDVTLTLPLPLSSIQHESDRRVA